MRRRQAQSRPPASHREWGGSYDSETSALLRGKRFEASTIAVAQHVCEAQRMRSMAVVDGIRGVPNTFYPAAPTPKRNVFA